MASKKFDIKGVLGNGWDVVKGNLGFFLLLGFAYFASCLLFGAGGELLDYLYPSLPGLLLLGMVITFAGWVILIVISIGIIKIALSFYNGQRPSIWTLFDARGCFWSYLSVQILYGFIVCLGLMLFIVPGIIWAVKYGLSSYFVIDKGLDPLLAFRASALATRGARWQLLKYYVISGLIMLAGLLCFGVGALLVFGVTSIAVIYVYRELLRQTPELADGKALEEFLTSCPKCGFENNPEAIVCESCGRKLKKYAFFLKYKASTSGFVSMALGLAVVISSPVILFLIVTFGLSGALVWGGLGVGAFYFCAPLSIAFGIASLSKIRKQQGETKGKYKAITGITFSSFCLILFIGVIALWRLDAEPMVEDYTLADLRSAPADCNKSYELLLSLSYEGEQKPKDAPATGLTVEDINIIERIGDVISDGNQVKIAEMLETSSAEIDIAWQNAAKGRQVIEELADFAEIADFTEPNIAADLKYFSNLRHLARLYQAHVYLNIHQGNEAEAARQLIRFDSVFRKLIPNSRSLVMRLVCIAVLAKNIQNANFIANNAQVNEETLELLAMHFRPFNADELSLRNSLIHEYLMFKNSFDYMHAEAREKNGGKVKIKTSMLKINSAYRLYRNFIDDRLEAHDMSSGRQGQRLKVFPEVYPDWIKAEMTDEGDEVVTPFYSVYNPIGSLLCTIMSPASGRCSEINTRLAIYDDLLQIVLNKRLSKEFSLKARAYGDVYIIDVENRKIFSPGPDGQIDTKDDIKLTIDPDVLRWSN